MNIFRISSMHSVSLATISIRKANNNIWSNMLVWKCHFSYFSDLKNSHYYITVFSVLFFFVTRESLRFFFWRGFFTIYSFRIGFEMSQGIKTGCCLVLSMLAFHFFQMYVDCVVLYFFVLDYLGIWIRGWRNVIFSFWLLIWFWIRILYSAI